MGGCGTAHDRNYTKGKIHYQEKCIDEILQEKELYFETDVLDVSLGTGHQQPRDRMQFPKDEMPGNSALWPITFTSKT